MYQTQSLLPPLKTGGRLSICLLTLPVDLYVLFVAITMEYKYINIAKMALRDKTTGPFHQEQFFLVKFYSYLC